MQFHQMSTEEALKTLNASPQGLSTAEAKKRLAADGANSLTEEKRKGVLRVFLEQFADFMIIILIGAAFLSMLTNNAESAIVILCVITLNAVLGTVQHFKAQKSLDSLQAMSSPTAKVLRDGQTQIITAADIVKGDIVLIEAGDIVPADGRILEAATLLVNESALTGEAIAIEKHIAAIDAADAALGDRFNMLYSGSTVQNGRGIMLVTATGMHTEIGKIADMMNKAQRKKTPLQVSLDKFGRWLSIGVLVLCGLILALSVFVQGKPILDAVMFAVALAVAAIPEALSSIITISLAIGTQKMAKQNAIIKDLKAVEGLGCVSVICSDKTGTLTMNKMTVRELFAAQSEAMPLLQKAMALCNDAVCNEKGSIGDPTETALAEYLGAEKYNQLRAQFPRENELPFDSTRKLMSTLHICEGEKLLFTKGAIDALLPRIKYIVNGESLRDFTEADKEQILNENLRFSEQGMRVLAFACKQADNFQLSFDDENDYIFIGLAAMTDPPRKESYTAVANCRRAGIKPVMITGDHKLTATAIAKEIGIFQEGDLCLSGAELEAMSDEELRAKLPRISVFARVSPEHKIRIVENWQQLEAVTAMTGDGVNDAPALKKADIGIAMGITGTAVSKDAASVILADDNFATIIKAVESGRSIYNNIKNAVKFLLAGNSAAILTVLVTALMNLPLPFYAVHLLFINLLTDSLPAIALSSEPMHENVLNRKPRPLSENILNKEALIYIGIHSVMLFAVTLFAYFQGLVISDGAATTFAFATLCLGRLFEGFDCRGNESLFRLGLLTNKNSIYAFLTGAVLLAAALFLPFMQGIMEVVALDTSQLLMIAGLAAAPFLLTQLLRIFRESVLHKAD